MPGRNSTNPQELLNQATQLARSGELDRALELVIQLPASVIKYQFQIDLLTNRRRPGDLQQAENICALWQSSAPESVQPLFQLMQLYWSSGRLAMTPPLAKKIEELEPEHRFTPYYQAISQQLNGDFQGACDNHRLAVLRNSDQKFSAVEFNLEVAIAAYEVAAGKYPGSPRLNEDALVDAWPTYDLMQSALQGWQQSKPDIKKLSAGQIIRYSNACYNLGCADASRYLGLNNALHHFLNALKINPSHELAGTNYLFVKNYDPDMSNMEALELARETTATFRRKLGPPVSSWSNDPDPERVLRIAYLSSDFRRHSVVHFITPVLEAHSRRSVQVHAYYSGHSRDKWTNRVESAVDQFSMVDKLTDQALHQKIIQDRIDILIDLNGFTRGHRVKTLMRRAAPIQVSWIGYPGSTGLDVMDYRIVDAFTDPHPGAKRYSSEQLLYMKPVFSIYLPDSDLPDVAAETPALKNGYVTFGSFNSLPKLNSQLLEMWGQILSRVDGSKLLVKNKMLDHPSVRKDVSEALASAGISHQRQILLGRTDPPQEHMKIFRGVDLCLDSYPYNGTTTNCDSFVMGVPVVTLTGSRHASRVTTSQLRSLNLGNLVAADSDQYIDIAVQLASDTAKLNSIRQGLRECLQSSALMDYQGFTQQLEAKYRDIWRQWCAKV